MPDNKSSSSSGSIRGAPLRQRVLDAAERLLREGKAEFSMRDLAGEAGVSFATPFNQFGSKVAIMHTMSARRIDVMMQRFVSAPRLPDTAARVLFAIDTAVAVMLEEPGVNRAVMEWIGKAGPGSGRVLEHSTALWLLALGGGEGLNEEVRELAHSMLAEQLAFGFRGVLSFWTAGELGDDELAGRARSMGSSLLRGFSTF